jgi:nitroreductase
MKNTIIQNLLTKRFATKQFDITKKVSEEDLQYILECARLSCSSLNIQPWLITVVTNPEIRAKIGEASFGQPQVTAASHLLVISAVKDEVSRAQLVANDIRSVAGDEAAQKYLQTVLGAGARVTPEIKQAWLQKQTYLTLQAMILAAADRDIDSCPMEGFDSIKVAEILGQTDAVPTTMLPIGYAAAPGRPKSRLLMDQIVKRVE